MPGLRQTLMLAAALCGLCASAAVAGEDASGLKPTGKWSQINTGAAPTPPMGWNSWNAFGVAITEAKVLGSAQVIHDRGLQDRGYAYINIDDGWWLKRRTTDGRMQVRTNLFPSAATGGPDGSSLRPFTDRLHQMGFKAGIYSDIGYNACSQAWSPDNPNLPEGSQAEREVGLMGHARQDIGLYFSDWNFDYIKVDACGLSAYRPTNPMVANGHFRQFGPIIADAQVNRSDIGAVKALYGELRDALRAVRPQGDYVLSLCNWGSANVRAWGKGVGTTWRTSNDIDPSWGRMLHNFDSVATRELYAGPGHWNDPDMLEIGNGAFDADHLVEARTHMSLWAIEASPLIIGTDLTKAPQSIIDILGAPEVIAVSQDPAGHQGVIAYADSEREIIVKSLSGTGEKAVLLLNRTAERTSLVLTPAHMKLMGDKPIAIRDLWAAKDLGALRGLKAFDLAPHQAILLKVVGTPALEGGVYLSEVPARINVAADGVRVPEPDPIIHRMMDPYHLSTTSNGNHPAYAGWGGPRADATPYDQGLAVAGASYRYGLGALANSRLQVKADGAFQKFVASVGIDDSTRGKSVGVRFELYGDGRLLAASKEMHFGEAAQEMSAPVAGVQVLELVARQVADSEANVVVSWAEARLVR